MTDQEKTSAEGGAIEPINPNGNDTTLERLAARLMEDLSDDGDGKANGRPLPVMLSEKYSGPFAHPDVLKKLDEVIDNGAERAFRLTEKEQEHRHQIDDKLVNSDIKQRDKEAFDHRLVIILIFTFLAVSLALAFVAVITGHTGGAALVAGAGAVISGGAALIARSRTRKDNS